MDCRISGTIAWYKAEGNANDAVGGHNGFLVNGTSFASGLVGQAFSLNGVNNYVNFGSSPAFDLGDLTLEAWVFIDPAQNHGERRILSRDDIGIAANRQTYALKSSAPFAGADGEAYFCLTNQLSHIGTPCGEAIRKILNVLRKMD